MFEIQSSQLALSKQADADTKPFAEKMVQDHQKTSNELKALVDGGKVKATLPTALDAEHQKMLDDLKAKNGKDFDQSYDQVQLKAHRDAVALSRLTPRAATMLSSRAGRADASPSQGAFEHGGKAQVVFYGALLAASEAAAGAPKPTLQHRSRWSAGRHNARTERSITPGGDRARKVGRRHSHRQAPGFQAIDLSPGCH